MYAVLLLPNFHLQAVLRFRREWAARALAVTDGQKGVVLEITSAAAEQGVRSGMGSIQAMARCPGLTLLPRAKPTELSVQATLLELAGTLSPDLEATAEGCVTVDLRGAKIADWPAWTRTVREGLWSLELEGKIGVAPNPDLAFLAARRAVDVLVVQAPAAFLARLTVAEIDPPPALQALLHDWGIHTLGQLTSLPRGQLADRLGPEADRLWQRAAGQTTRLLRLERPVEELAEAFDFEHEIETVEPLLFILRRLLEQLARRLQARHLVAARLLLTLPIDDGKVHERAFEIPSPTDDLEVLFRVVQTHLETLQLAGHPTGVRLWMQPVRPEHQQLRLFESALRDPNRFGETLARLAALVGAEQVGVAEVLDSHRPDAFRLVEPKFHLHQEEKTPPPPVDGLPLRRFRPPRVIQVRREAGRPVEIFGPSLAGEIVAALGPYFASGHWWDQDHWSVEEWDVEVAGHGLYRLRRDAHTWMLEGCYDAELC